MSFVACRSDPHTVLYVDIPSIYKVALKCHQRGEASGLTVIQFIRFVYIVIREEGEGENRKRRNKKKKKKMVVTTVTKAVRMSHVMLL